MYVKGRLSTVVQRIGKQDPYCAVALNTDKKRTPTVKKGGQTPEWDAELRFDVWQDMQDEMQSQVTPTGGIKPAAASEAAQQLANKPSKNSNKKVLSVSVWADDPKDPDLVGDATVDLTEPLKLGEWDGPWPAHLDPRNIANSRGRMGSSYVQGKVRWRGVPGVDVLLGGELSSLSVMAHCSYVKLRLQSQKDV